VKFTTAGRRIARHAAHRTDGQLQYRTRRQTLTRQPTAVSRIRVGLSIGVNP
jgi:hypothetical protein